MRLQSFFQLCMIRILLIISYLIAILFCSCSIRKGAESIKSTVSGNPIVTNAERLRLESFDGYIKATVLNPWQGTEGINFNYYFVRRGSVVPPGLDSSQVIFVPVKKIICMSTTHISMITALSEVNSIAGVSGANYIYSDSLAVNIRKGLVEDVGYEENLNKELILKISPDLVMMYGIGSESIGYVSKIIELGIKVVFNADYLETDPLAKAEWIKLFGILYCKEKLADSIYSSEVETYKNLKNYIQRNIADKPKVLLGLPYKDTWYVSPGNSYISKLIEDAGGNYLWQDTRSSFAMPLGIENVYLRSMSADFWLNIGSAGTRDNISAVDQRLKDLPCFRDGHMYNNIKRSTNSGGNDYWESGTIYPHLILNDIASILHPDLFSDYDLYFYSKIY
jgi:iron complex transport system substrate-binding protein